MSYLLTTLSKKQEVDSIIRDTIDKVLVLRFGRASDPVCLHLDQILSKAARDVSKFASVALIDVDSEDIQVYVKYFDITFIPSTVFFFNAHHMKMDSGTADHTKWIGAFHRKQDFIDVVENTDPSQDASSVYYVHPSDGPSSVIVTPVLSGSNYHAWARSMKRALGSKNKFDFVDGSIPIPEPFNPNYRAWSRCNMMVHSWLMNSVAESIGQSIVYLENAVDVWNDLKERFSQGDLIRISELQQEIYALRQGPSTVTEFYSELKVLWEELETYMPMPACSCPNKCSCVAMKNARKYHTLNYAIRFLTGLNENFSVVKSQILLMDPLPSMNRIFSMVIQHERQGNFAISDDSKALVNAVEYKRPQGKGRGSLQNSGFKPGNRVCTYCGRNGHTIETCYRKHGFPPHLQKHSGSMANNVLNDSYDQKELASMNDDERLTTPTFTHEQYEKLLNLIQNSSIGQQSVSATNQVSSSKVSQSTQLGHTPIENYKSGPEITEDDWFG